jgi:peptidoglycan/xylan/chitin deacetylase (PgdA/CDA1 family)
MRGNTSLAAVGAILIAVGTLSFMLGRTSVPRQPVAKEMSADVPDSELVTNTIASRHILAQRSMQAAEFQPSASPALSFTHGRTDTATALTPACTNPDALSVVRVVEIDTTGGPGFGFEHFKQYDFLRDHEVVLTFDDGPWPGNTPAIVKALAESCAKATFFQIGEHAIWHPEIAKQVAAAGMTIGSHTWSHKDLAKGAYATDLDRAESEVEMGISAVHIAVNGPIAPFFRFPELQHTHQLLSYLAGRNIASFSTDIDSFDFRTRRADQVVQSVMAGLEKRGKGIVLMHDFQPATAQAMPELLRRLKADGYKVVHLVPKTPVTTLTKFDDLVKEQDKLSITNTRPQNSVVRTVDE